MPMYVRHRISGPAAMVRVGAEALCEGVSGIPVGGEVGVAEDERARVHVPALSGALVGPDRLAFLAVVVLLVEVAGIDVPPHVEAVSVVGSDDDQSVFQRTELL